MKDIIYREDAINAVDEVFQNIVVVPKGLGEKIINPLPSAERTGHWVNVLYGLGADDAECSNCHNRTRMIPSRNADGVSVDFSFHNFCPHCGARMETKMPQVVTQGW